MASSSPDFIPWGRLVKSDDARYSRDAVMILVTSTVALYNSIELLILIFLRFKVYSGLYFWSITLTSLAIIPYCIGWITVNFYLGPEWLGMAIDSVGWMFLITGHSMVLYSRLNLVLHNPRILHAVLIMIITNAVILYPSVWVVYFGSRLAPNPSRSHFVSAINIVEKVQMTCFCIQEFIISGLYIWGVLGLLSTSFGSKRAFILKLCAINLFIIVIDIALLAIEYRGLFIWEQGIKVLTYSIKLKLEFAVLGQLVDFVRHGSASRSNPTNPQGGGPFVEISDEQTKKDTKRQSALRKAKSRSGDVASIGLGSATAAAASPSPSHNKSDDGKVKTRNGAGSRDIGSRDESMSSDLKIQKE